MKKCYGCVEEQKVSLNGNSRYEASSAFIFIDFYCKFSFFFYAYSTLTRCIADGCETYRDKDTNCDEEEYEKCIYRCSVNFPVIGYFSTSFVVPNRQPKYHISEPLVEGATRPSSISILLLSIVITCTFGMFKFNTTFDYSV